MTTEDAVKRDKPKRKPRGQFHHGDLREQVLLAAREMLEKKGIHAFSMKELATRLGVTEPAIYRHFEGREALVGEVALRGALEFSDALERATLGVDDPFESMRRYGRAYVRYCHANPGWFRVQFTRAASEGMMRHSDRVLEQIKRAEVWRDALLRVWARALPRGEEARVADLYRTVWTTAHGAATFIVERVWQLVQTDEERIAAADEALDLLVQSIEARAR
jgi:AcrR family transcriptional regulator